MKYFLCIGKQGRIYTSRWVGLQSLSVTFYNDYEYSLKNMIKRELTLLSHVDRIAYGKSGRIDTQRESGPV